MLVRGMWWPLPEALSVMKDKSLVIRHLLMIREVGLCVT